MSSITYPGVFIKESVPLSSPPCAPRKACPVFIGYTQKAIVRTAGETQTSWLTPILIHSFIDFKRIFGQAFKETFNVHVHEQEQQQTVTCKIEHPSPFVLYDSVRLHFENGGGPCYIIAVNDFESANRQIHPQELHQGLKAVALEPQINLIVIPEAANLESAVHYQTLIDSALLIASKADNLFLISDVYRDSTNNTSTNNHSSQQKPDTSHQEYGAAYYPYLQVRYLGKFDNKNIRIQHTIQNGQNTTIGPWHQKTLSQLIQEELITEEQTHAITTVIPRFKTIPPSGAIAGIYHWMDNSLGVWKAPAGLEAKVRGISGLTDAGEFPSHKQHNLIKPMPLGNCIWGARTLRESPHQYVPIRRFQNALRECLRQQIQTAVFEPNDEPLWEQIKAQVNHMLRALWRQGALAGSKPEEAFFVKVGLGESMTPADIEAGLLRVEIGVAMQRPAQFSLIRLEQKTAID